MYAMFRLERRIYLTTYYRFLAMSDIMEVKTVASTSQTYSTLRTTPQAQLPATRKEKTKRRAD